MIISFILGRVSFTAKRKSYAQYCRLSLDTVSVTSSSTCNVHTFAQTRTYVRFWLNDPLGVEHRETRSGNDSGKNVLETMGRIHVYGRRFIDMCFHPDSSSIAIIATCEIILCPEGAESAGRADSSWIRSKVSSSPVPCTRSYERANFCPRGNGFSRILPKNSRTLFLRVYESRQFAIGASLGSESARGRASHTKLRGEEFVREAGRLAPFSTSFFSSLLLFFPTIDRDHSFWLLADTRSAPLLLSSSLF